tara:strand:+ start:577 stop:918 length:342 start_codon:yes stop_codon:yes gene_type:complete
MDSFSDVIETPRLVEPGARYFLGETLNNCATFKKKYYNDMLNWSIACVVVFVFGMLLYYKYKGKPTPSQKMLKDREKQHYILSRIHNYQDAKKNQSHANITGLPSWENEYDAV